MDTVRLQRYPLGLLGLLDLKDMGQGPSEFRRDLTTVIDATPFYLASRPSANSGQALAVNATGFFAAAGLTITEQTVWVIQRMSARPSAALAAGVSIRYRLAISRAAGNNIVALPNTASGAPTEFPNCAVDGPLLLLPGDALGIWVEQIAGGAINVNFYVHFTALAY